jgi:hypothetical protein
MAGDLYAEGTLRFGRAALKDRVNGGNTDGQQDQRGRQRPGELEAPVASGGTATGAGSPKAVNGKEQGRLDQ